jgi:hypothetical protein
MEEKIPAAFHLQSDSRRAQGKLVQIPEVWPPQQVLEAPGAETCGKSETPLAICDWLLVICDFWGSD